MCFISFLSATNFSCCWLLNQTFLFVTNLVKTLGVDNCILQPYYVSVAPYMYIYTHKYYVYHRIQVFYRNYDHRSHCISILSPSLSLIHWHHFYTRSTFYSIIFFLRTFFHIIIITFSASFGIPLFSILITLNVFVKWEFYLAWLRWLQAVQAYTVYIYRWYLRLWWYIWYICMVDGIR